MRFQQGSWAYVGVTGATALEYGRQGASPRRGWRWAGAGARLPLTPFCRARRCLLDPTDAFRRSYVHSPFPPDTPRITGTRVSGNTVTLTFTAPTNPNLGPVASYALSCLPEGSVSAMSGPADSTASERRG